VSPRITSKLPINLAELLRKRTMVSPEFESDDDRTHLLIRLPVHTRAVEQAEVGAQSEQIMAALLKAPLSISEILNQLLFVWPTYLASPFRQ